jgi:transposase
MGITVGNATVKRITFARQIAERLNHVRLFNITECLLRLHAGQSACDIAHGLPMSRRTVYHWLDLFIRRRFAWLCGHHDEGRGRKATLNAEQKQRLYELIETGPLEADCTCGVWTSSMIAVLIERECGVTYHPRYVCRCSITLASRLNERPLCRLNSMRRTIRKHVRSGTRRRGPRFYRWRARLAG